MNSKGIAMANREQRKNKEKKKPKADKNKKGGASSPAVRPAGKK
jgi:hypothetical protein